MQDLNLSALAMQIKNAQDEARQIEPFTARHRDFDIPTAYEVARLVHEARLAEGATAVGRKIGFTNPQMWSLYGVDEPVWAHVYDRSVIYLSESGSDCPVANFTEPKIEPEIVVHFHTAPPAGAGAEEILTCIDWVAHGIEIVQSHFPDWKFKAADTIADAALHATLLVGERCELTRLGPRPLAALRDFTVELACDGRVCERGRGANALGSPLKAVGHLISVLAGQQNAPPLQAGELVTTGTLTAALPISPGQRWRTSIDGIALPGLSVRITR